MAFVHRAQRKTDSAKPGHLAGPGSYQLGIQKQSRIPKAYVPFGTMENRQKDNYNKQSLPGPGSYNIADNTNGQKIVISSETQDIKILQISRPHPVFKSGTERFAPIKEQNIIPGPGQYNINRAYMGQRPKMYSTNTNNLGTNANGVSTKPKIIQHLISINKYQSIPSIPSNIHAYGYNENENNELELNEPPIEVYNGQKEDRIGPGHYNVTNKERAKGVSCWSQAKEKKLQYEYNSGKVNENVGPGSYDIKSVQSLYNYKPSSTFASKTMRSGDQKLSAIAQQQQNKNVSNFKNTTSNKIIEDGKSVATNNMDSRVFSQKNAPSTRIDDESSDQYEYIDDTTPGPGSYLEISDVKKFNKPSRPAVPSFGVGTKRFTQTNSTHVNTNTNNQLVGPGSYDPKLDARKIKSKNKQIVVSQKDKEYGRFPMTNAKQMDEPGPGAYQPRNTMQDKLIYKIQRGYRGQFGSTQIRSKEAEDNDQPGPGEYDPQPVKQQKQSLSSFKSNTKRKGLVSSNNVNVPAPGVYNTNNYDISTRIIKQQEDDPDLIIKKPGFGVGEKRFRDSNANKEQQFDDDDIIKQIQDKYKQEKKKKLLKNSASFKSGEPRIKESKNDAPGPGAYYDGEEDHWNKRTYNILFADI